MELVVQNPATKEKTDLSVLENRGFYYAYKAEYDRVCTALSIEPDKHFLPLDILPGQGVHTVRVFDHKKNFFGNIYTQPKD